MVQIFALFARASRVAYFAAQEQAPESLIAAALLHDIGHFFSDEEDMAARGVDGRHESAGEISLRRYLSPAVREPIRLHVEAKRYLCHLDPSYPVRLSATSLVSLKLQPGAFNKSEAVEFECRLYAREAVRLRRWDVSGKIQGWMFHASKLIAHCYTSRPHYVKASSNASCMRSGQTSKPVPVISRALRVRFKSSLNLIDSQFRASGAVLTPSEGPSSGGWMRLEGPG